MKIAYSLIVLTLITVLAACGGAEERKAAYMEKAEISLNAGDLDKARIELKNVLQIDPKDAEAYFKLGDVFEQKKEYRKAFGSYNKAAELEPDNIKYQAKLGRFYLTLAGDIEKAKEKLELIKSKDRSDINGLLLEAGILVKQDKRQESRDIVKGIFDSHPENIESAIFLASLYSEDKEYGKAIEILDVSVEKNPDDLSIQNSLASLLLFTKDYDRAENIYKGILVKHNEVFGNHLRLAAFYQRIGKSGKAEEVLRSAIDAEPDNVERKLVLAEFIQQTNGNQASIAELKKMIKDYPDMSELRLALGNLEIAEKELDSALNTYKQVVKDFSEEEAGIKARITLAKIYMQRENVESAVDVIEDAIEISPNDAKVNLVKAKIALYNKNIEQAIISLRTVIKDDPENIEAYFLLAAAHISNNEADQAEDVILRAHENNRVNIKALLPLAKYHLQNRNASEAEKIIDDYIALDANNYEAMSIKSSILNNRKEFNEAFDLAEKMVTLHPDKPNGYLQSVPALLSRKETVKAVELLVSGYAKTKNIQIYKLLAEIQIATGKQDEAIAGLKNIANAQEDESIQMLIAKAYAAKGDIDSAKNVLLDSINNDNSRIQTYTTLAGIYQNEKNTQQAISLLEQGVTNNPEDSRLHITLAGLYERMGEIDKAISQYETLMGVNDSNLIAINNLAALLSEYRTDKSSLEKALNLVDKIKDAQQPVIKDTVAWVYYKNGKYSEAAALLEEVTAAMPDVNVFNYHLGMAYYKSGDKDNARKYLELATSDNKKFTGYDIAKETLKNL